MICSFCHRFVPSARIKCHLLCAPYAYLSCCEEFSFLEAVGVLSVVAQPQIHQQLSFTAGENSFFFFLGLALLDCWITM